MYRHRAPKPRERPEVDPLAHNGITAYLRRFLDWSASMNYSPRTVEIRDYACRRFIGWCDERGLTKPQDITKPILERYRRYLYHYRKENGEPLSFPSQHTRLVPLKAFFKWLAKENHILYNPASELELPRLHRRLPKHLLTHDEIERILNQTSLHGAIGIRDRAIIETLYSTGMRRMEAANLKLYDVDLNNGSVMIRGGKGNKDRLIPIGERACAWISKYIEEVRPGYVVEPDDGTVFLAEYGEPLHKGRLTDIVRKHIVAAGIDKPGSCHLFRHTMATQMLENGADIRYIQAMLGHSSLSTTEIYTQVSIRKLKEIHTATHPARLARTRTAEADTLPDADALFTALAAEADEDEAADGDEVA
jgi:integrase/recombinase XerD